MKICESCGHRNWVISRHKKKEICSNCQKELKGAALNNPMIGHNEIGVVEGDARFIGHIINPLKTPNE